MQIQGLSQLAAINIKGISDILSKLNIGDKIKAQVLSTNGNEITLKLPGGTNVTATMLVPLEVTLGDFLEFSVKGKDQSQIILETSKASPQEVKSNEVANTLLSLKLPPDERNVEIAKNLMNQNLPINKENVKNVVNLLSKYKGLDIEKAVFVFANNIEQVENGVEILNKLTNNAIRNEISNNTTQNVLPNNTLTNISEKDVAQIGKMINNLVQLLDKQPDKKIVSDIISKYKSLVINNEIAQNDKQISTVMSNFKGSNEETEKLYQNIVKQVIIKSENIDTILNKPITQKEVEKLINNLGNKDLENLIEKNPEVKQKIIDLLNDKAQLKEFALKYNDFKLTYNQKSNVNSETLPKIKEFLDISPVLRGKMLEGNFDSNKIFNELVVKLNVIKDYITQNPVTNSESIISTISNIDNHISFMNNVNNMYMFFQMPVVMNQNETNVDLYFVKNNRESKKIDPDNATMFISLNTSNLGVVESLISIQLKKVNFNFSLEDNDIIDYFKKNQSFLEELIEDLGYTIGRISYSLSENPTDVVSFNRLIKDKKASPNTVDIRI